MTFTVGQTLQYFANIYRLSATTFKEKYFVDLVKLNFVLLIFTALFQKENAQRSSRASR